MPSAVASRVAFSSESASSQLASRVSSASCWPRVTSSSDSFSRQVMMPAALIPRMKRPWTPAHFHGLRDGGGVVVHGLRVKHARRRRAGTRRSRGDEERLPVLVQRDDADHHEEVEVHLDEPVG